jgi:hypothetical protein
VGRLVSGRHPICRGGDVAGRNRLEYPIGKVLNETGGWISHPRVSRRGDMIAFLDHPVEGVRQLSSASHARNFATFFLCVLSYPLWFQHFLLHRPKRIRSYTKDVIKSVLGQSFLVQSALNRQIQAHHQHCRGGNHQQSFLQPQWIPASDHADDS